MDNPLGPETGGVLLRVGNVVAMGQEDVADAAARLELPRQALDIAWRVDQPVPVGMFDEIAVAAKRFLRIEAAVRNAFGKGHRELIRCRRGVRGVRSADRPRRTGDQRSGRGPPFALVPWLDSH